MDEINNFNNKEINNIEHLFLDIIHKGNLKNTINFYNKNKNEINNNLNITYEIFFKHACCHLDIGKWLWNLSKKLNLPADFHFKNEDLFIDASYRGDLNTLKWLWEISCEINSPININANKKNVEFNAFNACFWNNKIEIAEWLWDLSINNNSPINIHNNYEYPFIIACSFGHLDAAKWLWNLSLKINSPININIQKDNIFRKCCSFGKIDSITWLWDLSLKNNHPINLHAIHNQDGNLFLNNPKDAFTLSCEGGHLNIANWILNKAESLNTPISLENRVFVWKYVSKKYIKTANELINLYQKTNKTKIKPNYEIISEKKNGRILRKIILSFKNLTIDNTSRKFNLCHHNDKIDI